MAKEAEFFEAIDDGRESEALRLFGGKLARAAPFGKISANAKREDGESALGAAARMGMADLAEALLEAGAAEEGPAMREGKPMAPLELCRLRLEEGLGDRSGFARIRDRLERRLRSSKTLMFFKEGKPFLAALEVATRLGRAARRGDVAEIERLVSAGADPNGRASSENVEWSEWTAPTALHMAVMSGQWGAARALAALGADMEARLWRQVKEEGSLTFFVWEKRTPLQIAAQMGSWEGVRALLELGADPRADFEIESHRGERSAKSVVELAPSQSLREELERARRQGKSDPGKREAPKPREGAEGNPGRERAKPREEVGGGGGARGDLEEMRKVVAELCERIRGQNEMLQEQNERIRVLERLAERREAGREPEPGSVSPREPRARG